MRSRTHLAFVAWSSPTNALRDLNWPGATLPPSAATESWIEQTVTIPAGATTLQAGVTWNTVTSGAIFYLNEFEITQLTTVTPEYQYHLKDHLGNVRVTFTSKDETESATATLETANMNAEQAKFLRYQNARRIQSTLFDRTNGSATGFAQRLNGSANEKYGLVRSISVMPGDKINMEVYAKYVDTNSSNWTAALNTLMTQIAAGTAPAGTVVDGSSYSTSTSSFPFPGLVNTTGSTGGPKAYLNYIIFDRNFAFKTGGYKRLSAIPRETGNDVAHERLFFDNLTITEPGYIYIFLSNEETSPVEVFFDDFKVEHVKSPIVSTSDYYPYGLLTANSYTRENAVPNRYLFQEKEWQDDLALNVYDFEWRQYDPIIARTTTQDPHADFYWEMSPYSFLGNNPINFLDPSGMDTVSVHNLPNQSYDPEKDVVMLDEVVVTAGDEESSSNSSEENKSDYPWYEFFADHNPGGDFLYEANKYNPVAIVFNSANAYAIGTDTYGVPMSGSDATMNLAMTVPVGRVAGTTSKVTTNVATHFTIHIQSS